MPDYPDVLGYHTAYIRKMARNGKLRADKKGRVPKTRQLVAESEKLIGREGERPSSGRAILVAVLFVAALLGVGYLVWTLT